MEKNAKQKTAFVVILIGCIFISIFLFFSLGIFGDRVLSPILSKEEIQSGLPARLTIPRIGVSAVLEFVSLTTNGEMDVPKDPANVAWFDSGPRPGEEGSAVIAGHYGWKDDLPAVFDDLSALQKGDPIYIEDENGVLTTFVVRELRSYGEDEDVPEVFGSIDGKAHLNLVTCEGVWDAISKSYSKRLVVFTDKK